MSALQQRGRTGVGRPVATSHAEIEHVAFQLFAQRGFEGTTLDNIAAEVGVSRRTLTRYFESKNDIPWGQFARTLDIFRQILGSMPKDLELWDAIHQGVLAFNDFPADADPSHRERMRLILSTPALQAHSVHKYAEWRAVIADFVAARLALPSDSLFPRTVGQVSLAIALTAYEAWLAADNADLQHLLNEAFHGLRDSLATTL
jgi:mycofactocin system transcriptional regulator